MLIKTRYVEDELFESENIEGIKQLVDMRPKGKKEHFTPVEMLLSAIGSCAAVDVVSMIKKRRKVVNDFVVEVEGKRREDYPKAFTDIHAKFVLYSSNANQEELEKATKMVMEKYCSVASSLNAEVTFSSKIIKA